MEREIMHSWPNYLYVIPLKLSETLTPTTPGAVGISIDTQMKAKCRTRKGMLTVSLSNWVRHPEIFQKIFDIL